MKYLLPILLLFYNTILAQTCTIKGNVFWKYNDFIGNRADAGCAVFVKNVETGESMLLKTDVKGDFGIDNLKEARYLVMTVSKSVKKEPVENLREILRYSSQLEKGQVFLFKPFSQLIDSFINIGSEYDSRRYKLLTNSDLSKKEKRREERELSTLKIKVDELAIKLYSEIKLSNIGLDNRDKNLPIMGVFDAVKVEMFKLNPGDTKTVIVDYGITYI